MGDGGGSTVGQSTAASGARRDLKVGIILLIASVGFISIVDTIAKYMTADLHAIEIVWGYFVGISVGVLVSFIAMRQDLRQIVRTRRLGMQLLRSALLIGTIATLFIALSYLTLADATAIGFATPFFTTILSIPLLSERVGQHRWIAVIIGFIGVLIVVRPGGGVAHWAALVQLASALIFAGFQITTRMMATSEDNLTTLFYTAAGGLLWTSLMVPFFWTTPTFTHWLLFLGSGALGAAAHFCLINAFQRAQASVLSPFNYTKLIWVSLLGYAVFGNLPSLNTVIGCSIIIASGIYLIYREHRVAAGT